MSVLQRFAIVFSTRALIVLPSEILKRRHGQGKDSATLAWLVGNRQETNLDNKALIINRQKELSHSRKYA
jgi:hypothetical protein